jgi:purine-binding chemotaxis protein CheW
MSETLTADLKLIIFLLKDKEYAIPVSQVRSIEKVQHITRVPGAASSVKGVINLRGVVTPIIDLRTRFGLEQKDHTDSTRVIIASADGMEVGLVVDGANDVIDISGDSIEPSPNVIGAEEAEFISGVVKVEKRLLILIDLGKILENGEMKLAANE